MTNLFSVRFMESLPALTFRWEREFAEQQQNKKKTQLVKNVHEFPGHIACDSQSNSEIVVPLFKENKLKGVIDIDSPKLERFDDTDKKYLELFAELLERYVSFPEVFI